jgi:hypothetical protein
MCRVEHAADLNAHKMKAHKDGWRSIPVIEIDFTFKLHTIPDRLCAAKPLNAPLEIAANYMPKVFSRKLVVFTRVFSGKQRRRFTRTTCLRRLGRLYSAAPRALPSLATNV